jgi:hypothetical protein
MNRKVLLFILLEFNLFLSYSQSLQNTLFRIDGHYGFVIPEYKNLNYTVQRPISAIELSVFKRTMGKSFWEQIYKYPEYGLTLQYTTLGNKKVLGSEIGLFPYVQFFFLRKPKVKFTHQYGLGLGYASQKFDLTTNYDAVSIGSHLNIHFNFKLGLHFQFSEFWNLNTGISFTHFSNANMAEPNIGLNLLYYSLGISHSLGNNENLIKKEIEPHRSEHEFNFIYSAGGKHTRALQSTIFFTSSFSSEYNFHWKRKIHLGIGLDLFYDSSTKAETQSKNENNYKKINDLSSGIHLSQEIVYDRFSFILQEGFYVGIPNQIHQSLMYNRAIVRWKINDYFLMNISMKSHLHILDYPEIGFGYYFKTRK